MIPPSSRRAPWWSFPLLLAACGSGGGGLPDSWVPGDPGPSDQAASPEDAATHQDPLFDRLPPDAGDDPGQPDPSPVDAIPDPSAPDAPGTDPGPVPDLPADPGPPPGPCESAGGLCVINGQDCRQGGGTPLPDGDSQCLFDDGPLYCCIPPSPAPSGTGCADRGGLCVTTPGVCYRTGGLHAPRTDDCPPGPGSMCCLPSDRCPPGDDLECCMGSWTAVPLCDRGTWTCLGGGSPQPRGSCLPE
ncbi:hypothetical protein KBD49_11735 [Myxococcota bacterium]|nr:hypothetical protein [Myxococcota bacterium]